VHVAHVTDAQNNHPNMTISDLSDAVFYIVDFNLRGLLKIQNELFFPWVKTQILQLSSTSSSSSHSDQDIAQAFVQVVDDLIIRGNKCRELGQQLVCGIIVLYCVMDSFAHKVASLS
jgi:hypothetical protein